MNTIEPSDKCVCREIVTKERLYENLHNAINYLEQESKAGHWKVEIWNNREHHICSACQKVVDYEPCYHYCPYCGAKMVESEE